MFYSGLCGHTLAFPYPKNAHSWFCAPSRQFAFFWHHAESPLLSPLRFLTLVTLFGVELVPGFLSGPTEAWFLLSCATCCNQLQMRLSQSGLQPLVPSRNRSQSLGTSRCCLGCCQISVPFLSMLPPLAHEIRIPSVPRWLTTSHADPELLGPKEGLASLEVGN